jgi:predicted PurR-regulated permease PerM
MKPQNVRTFAVVALAAMALFLLHRLIAPILWASVIAVATWPLHQRLDRAAGPRFDGASALLLTGAVVVFVGVPFTYLVLRGLRELPSLLHLWASSQQAGLPAPDWVAGLPKIGPWGARQWNDALGEPGALSGIVHSLLGKLDLATGRSLLADIARNAMAFFFCILVLICLYLDGDALAAQIDAVVGRQLGPAGQRTLALVVRSVRGAVNGLVLVGLGVGVLMTVAYAVADVPHAVALGLATGLFGMVPFGATVILAFVAFYLLAVGATTAAIALAVAGAVAIFVADHFVRPALMGAGSKLPMVLTLLGIVGGLETFGALGLFLGPTLLAVVAAVWRELAAPRVDAPVTPP